MTADAAVVIDALRRRGQSVATAESLTGGGVCARLTAVAGASDVVRGALVVYASDLKVTLAGVDADLLRRRGAVNAEVARQLADGARSGCAADWGIGLTGVAGPGPSDGIAAGTVYVGLSGPATRLCRSLTLSGDRDAVRRQAADAALALLLEHVREPVR